MTVDAISTWVALLRAVAVMMSRGDEAKITLEQALRDQEDRHRFRIVLEGDTVTLLYTMRRLAEIYGPPPGRRIRELSPEALLQAEWRRARRRR